MNSYYKGIFTEYLAIIILFLKGYRILERRYKTKYGEIDIITKKGNNIIAIEVKARFKNIETTEHVSKHQINRIKNAINYYISKNNKYINCNINVEIILFVNYYKFKHFKNLGFL